MMNESKKATAVKYAAAGALALVLLLPSSLIPAMAAETVVVTKEDKTFKDIHKDYWAADSIKWAASQGLIKGFPDGTFKPNEVLTEEQFTTMLTRFYEDISLEVENTTDVSTKKWSDQKYEGLAHYKVPLLGYDDSISRNNPVNRGLIAQVFGFLQGNKADLEEAIQFLFDEGISKGSNPDGKTIYEKFGTTDQLTRAQAVAFFKRFHDAGNVTLHPEVTADKIEVDRVNDSVEVIKEQVEKAKNEAKAKVNPDVLPNKKEFVEKKKELIELKKQVIEEKKNSKETNGKELSGINKAIGDANKAGDLKKKEELLKEKQELLSRTKNSNQTNGKDLSDINKAIGDANRTGDYEKKQELIKEKQDAIQDKKNSNQTNGKDLSDINKAIGEANKAGDYEKKQELIKEKQDAIQDKKNSNQTNGKDLSDINKAIGEANRNGDYGKKEELIKEKQEVIQDKKDHGQSNQGNNPYQGNNQIKGKR